MRPTRFVRDASSGTIPGLTLQGSRKDSSKTDEIPCTKLLISAGAWSPQVYKTLFPSSKLVIPITSLAGHSVVVRNPKWDDQAKDTNCHAVFTTLPGGDFSPEVFSRAGGEIYIAGLNSAELPLPQRPEDAEIDSTSISRLMNVSRRLLGPEVAASEGLDSNHGDLVIVREGLCFRPVTRKGTPIIAELSDDKIGKAVDIPEGGVFLASGHGPWGISLSLGSGLVMAEMLEGKSTSANVTGLRL